MNIIATLRTPVATLIVLCAALLAQLPHAADVFRVIVQGNGLWPTLHGYAYAVALELAVLLFVVQRRNVESYIFAVVSVLVNLSYYALHGIDLLSVAALPAWLVSIALPAAIARYSHLLVEAPERTTTEQPQAENTPVEVPASTIVVLPHYNAPIDVPAPLDEAQIDVRTRALLMANEGKTPAEISRELDAKPSTVRSWLRRATAHTNGVAA